MDFLLDYDKSLTLLNSYHHIIRFNYPLKDRRLKNNYYLISFIFDATTLPRLSASSN